MNDTNRPVNKATLQMLMIILTDTCHECQQ